MPHNKLKTNSNTIDEVSLVRNPCYFYSKKSEIKFFSDLACSILFYLAKDAIRESLNKKENIDAKKNSVLDELLEQAILRINQNAQVMKALV